MPTKIIGEKFGMLTVNAATTEAGLRKKKQRGAEKGPAEVAFSPGPMTLFAALLYGG